VDQIRHFLHSSLHLVSQLFLLDIIDLLWLTYLDGIGNGALEKELEMGIGTEPGQTGTAYGIRIPNSYHGEMKSDLN